MKQNDIAKKYSLHKSAVSMLKHGTRFTHNRELAKELSALTGKKAYMFIEPKSRDIYIAADPSLAKRYKWRVVLMEG